MRVAFLGMGIMGARMARNLLRKGFALTVWNRSPGRTEALAAEGARVAATPAEAAVDADVVCTCLADVPAMEAVCRGPEGLLGAMREGTALVDFSTLLPDYQRSLARDCEALGVHFLESPVTGSKNGAEAGTLVLMCGGRRELIDTLMPLLLAVGSRVVHVGEVGEASQVKLIGNLIIAHMMQGLSEGAALARKAGIPFEKLLEVVQASGYASPYWDFKGKAIRERDFEAHFPLDLMHKDLTQALQTGQALCVPMPGTAAIRELYQVGRAQGLGALDFAVSAALVDPELLGR